MPYAEWVSRGNGKGDSRTEIPAEHPYFIGYTSGTTGAPRALWSATEP